jgi:hypothetical protein
MGHQPQRLLGRNICMQGALRCILPVGRKIEIRSVGRKNTARAMDQHLTENMRPVDGSSGKGHAGAWVVALVLLGLVLFFTNPWFTIIDDEVQAFVPARQAAGQLIHAYWMGEGPHHRPPLFDLIHDGWLHVTSGNLLLLRMPSILFYLLGIWLLALAAGRLAGPSGMRNLLLISLLWPFGFHFGRLAVGYSWYFFLVALVTLAYLRLLEQQTPARWALLVVGALALVYSNYFGWPMLACLTIDFCLEQRGNFLKHWRGILGTYLLLVLACLPQWHSVVKEVRFGPELSHSLASTVFYAGFAGYVLFVSESVAPWFWQFSVPAILAIAVCLGILALCGTRGPRRFLLYFFAVFGTMIVLGILTTKRTMLIAPWLLLPLGITLAALDSKTLRRGFFMSLALVFGIGWFGVVSRQYYAAPRFLEPWSQAGREAARSVEQGAIVIGNHPSFFLYLTSALQNPTPASAPRLTGVLTYSTFNPSVYQPDQWVEAGRPLRPVVVLVQGVPFLPGTGEMEKVQGWLSERCQLMESHGELADPGYGWKDKYRPDLGQSAWRIKTRSYSCPGRSPRHPVTEATTRRPSRN